MKSLVDQMLAKVVEKEPDVLIAPEDEKEFVPVDLDDEDEFTDEEPAEEEGLELADPVLMTLNVLSIVATKAYPYGGFFNDEDGDEVNEEWGGEQPPNPYSHQDDEDDI
jgi:hypothetical protein